MIEVFDENDVKECLAEVKDSDQKFYAYCLLDWAVQKRKVQAIPFPKGATNGDMIKAMFPNCETTFYTNIANIKLVRVCLERDFNSDYTEQLYLADWWNAPYKRGSENE